MGKILIIKDADFSSVALDNVTLVGNGPAITISASGEVTITDNLADVIYYTTDGSTPTTNSDQYSSVFTVSNGTTIKAISVYEGNLISNIVSEVYTSNEDLTYEKEYVSSVVAGKGYMGASSTYPGKFETLTSKWCSVFIKKSDCIDFVPVGFTIEVTTANPNNAVGYSAEQNPSNSTYLSDAEPMNTNSEGKYYAEFANNAVAYGINFNVNSSAITSIKVTFYN